MALTVRDMNVVFEGDIKIRILDACVAGGRPRCVGDVLTVDLQDGLELVYGGRAEKFIEAPELKSLE